MRDAGLRKVVARFLGTDEIDFTFVSVTGLGDRRFDDEDDLQDEVTNARVRGGVHFRSAIEDGTKLGLKVADYVLAHNVRETRD